MNENLLQSIKRSGIISLSTNIDLSRESIFNEFSKYGINDINLINKFIEENTIDPQTVEENKVMPMKDKIIVSEIDRVYKETREKPVKPEKSEEPEEPEKSEEPENPENSKNPENSEKSENTENTEKSEKPKVKVIKPSKNPNDKNS